MISVCHSLIKMEHITKILSVFNGQLTKKSSESIPNNLIRKSVYLQSSVFNNYQSETEMLRYIHRLEKKDLSLV